jgi:hypothetical protein
MRPRLRSSIHACLVVVASLSLGACGGSSSDDGPSGDSPYGDNTGPIIDHTCTDLARVPVEWFAAARQNLRVAYGHTSHGSQIVTGMEAMRGWHGSLLDFTSSWGSSRSDAFLMDSGFDGASDLGSPDRRAWSTATRRLLSSSEGRNRNVIMWSWCGQVDGSTQEIQSYLDQMAGLEREFPSVRFVYMTGHLDGSGAGGNVNLRNEQIRAYCRAHERILFDFADIESFDPGGQTSYMPLGADDGCNYSQGGQHNWAQEWVAANRGHELAQLAAACDDCAHSERLNCILKARAFWWMMARLAGWDGRS